MKKLDEVLKSKTEGLYYGNRVLLPFKVDLLKAIIENDIITDFSHTNKSAHYNKTDGYTEIYFYDYSNLGEVITKYEMIKIVVVEDGKDIFNLDNHRKLGLRVSNGHSLTIEEIDDEVLFIE